MRNPYLIILFFVAALGYSQSHGISYQAVLLNPKGEELPGQNNSYSPLLNKDICLRFEIRNATNQLEYQENINTKTDAFGMVNLVIGSGNQTGGTAANFNAIRWNTIPKKLVVALDAEGNCSSFTEISNQDFTGVPFAFSAQNAENVTGVVAIANGGTSATTAPEARLNLGLGNVDNTSDNNKPISIATQTALDLKEDKSNKSNTIVADATSDVKYPTVKAIKDYVDVYTTATQTALDLKEDKNNKSTTIVADAASDAKYPTVKAIKDYVDSKSSTGTLNYLPKFTSTTTLGDSNIYDNGSEIVFETDVKIKGMTLGVGPKSISSTATNNIVFGKDAFKFNTEGIGNIAIGNNALKTNLTGSDNIAIGVSTLSLSLSGVGNTAIGASTLNSSKGSNNTGIGAGALANISGSNQSEIGDNNISIGNYSLGYINNGTENTAIGYGAGSYAGSGTTPLTLINNSTFIGSKARAKNATNDTNEIVIGYNTVGLGSNTTVIGNDATILTAFHGAYTNYASNDAASATTIDFSKSNIAYTAAPDNSITLTNLRDGGIYYLATTATSVADVVSFTAANFTFKYMGTTARISGKTHMYRFVVAGTTVFVSMEKEN
ncbi:MAG: hypothetical protein KA509_05120 [Flavobacterium sp.]|jgi:hypothetical protein|nr:hypothetical protein [Flavobacterium sp.]